MTVTGIDFLKSENGPQHHTDAYNITNLVVRRGQPFLIQLSFSRELTASDKLSLRFGIGKWLPAPRPSGRAWSCCWARHGQRGPLRPSRVLCAFPGENPMKIRGTLLALNPRREQELGGWQISIAKNSGREVEPVGSVLQH